MVVPGLIFPGISNLPELSGLWPEQCAMTWYVLNATSMLSAVNPAKFAWAQGLMILFAVAIVAVFFGWVMARWMRLRFVRMTSGVDVRASLPDAWAEAARRIHTDDDTVDLDPPPDQSPPRDPNSRWQS